MTAGACIEVLCRCSTGAYSRGRPLAHAVRARHAACGAAGPAAAFGPRV